MEPQDGHEEPVRVWTIGHSTDAAEEFQGKLRAHGIEVVADVRRFPGSRRHPHFGQEAFAAAVHGIGIEYVHLPELGGRRSARKDSHNTAWRVEAFRGYADYMETPPFEAGMERLMEFARAQRTVIMCAERVWWSCHRALISDWLKAHGHEVLHILAEDRADPHPYTSAARIVQGRLSYRTLF